MKYNNNNDDMVLINLYIKIITILWNSGGIYVYMTRRVI